MNRIKPSRDLSPLHEALADITIHEIWRYMKLPGIPDRRCRSPFRRDRNPSFSIFKGGRHWSDHGTGESGDLVGFICKATGKARPDACRWLVDYHRCYRGAELPSVTGEPPLFRPGTIERRGPELPPLRLPTVEESKTIADSRGICAGAVLIPVVRGFLTVAEFGEHVGWVLTDQARRNAQARRLDRELWGHDSKVMGFRGNQANWPIGIKEAQSVTSIALVEGTPDFLAAYHFILREFQSESVAPVCVTGSAVTITPDALPLFQGKRVRIFAHNEASGQRGSVRWAEQLRTVCAQIDIFDFRGLVQPNGKPVKDLNDLCLVESTNNDPRLQGVMTFR